jgi:formylglycine-generating enzyme required for sulfatase activity
MVPPAFRSPRLFAYLAQPCHRTVRRPQFVFPGPSREGPPCGLTMTCPPSLPHPHLRPRVAPCRAHAAVLRVVAEIHAPHRVPGLDAPGRTGRSPRPPINAPGTFGDQAMKATIHLSVLVLAPLLIATVPRNVGGQPANLNSPLCPECPRIVTIPTGSFSMGNYQDSRPRHPVTVPSFGIGMMEVTRDEYHAFATAEGLPPLECYYRPDEIARCVTWHQAQAYVAWLTARTGERYRLPSEAEWEYVAQLLNDETGSPFGVLNIFTGAREWMADSWNLTYNGAPTDGSPWANDVCAKRVLRGGTALPSQSFDRRRDIQRQITLRISGTASTTSTITGFRVAKTLQPSPAGRAISTGIDPHGTFSGTYDNLPTAARDFFIRISQRP